jgi:hypothetical protein
LTPQTSGHLGVENNIDLIKEYVLSRQGQDIDIQQLLECCVTGELATVANEQPTDHHALLSQ